MNVHDAAVDLDVRLTLPERLNCEENVKRPREADHEKPERQARERPEKRIGDEPADDHHESVERKEVRCQGDEDVRLRELDAAAAGRHAQVAGPGPEENPPQRMRQLMAEHIGLDRMADRHPRKGESCDSAQKRKSLDTHPTRGTG